MPSVHRPYIVFTAVSLFLFGCGGNSSGNGGGSVPPAPASQALPNMGQELTPLAPENSRFLPMNPGPLSAKADNRTDWLAGQAVSSAVSPDQKTLLVLLSGFNLYFDPTVPANTVPAPIPEDSQQYVFVYDISTTVPVQKQVVKIPNTYFGIAWDPSGSAFYVAGGNEDLIRTVTLNVPTGLWEPDASQVLACGNNKTGLGVGVAPCAAGLAISPDGKTLVAANYFNDSITVFTGGLGHWSAGTPCDLRPGKSSVLLKGTAGGTYPFWVAVKGNGASAVAYVSSIRDREIDVVKLDGTPAVTARIKVKGQPNKMTLNRAQTALYVAEDQTDTVDVIDTASNKVVETIPVIAPLAVLPRSLKGYTGANTNSVALSPDEKQLYVTNGNLNCVSVVALSGTNREDQVVGLIPTGWYPNSVSFSGKGDMVYVVNGKSPTGPNPGFYYAAGIPTLVSHTNGLAANLYNPQLIKAGFQSFPRPVATQLTTLTAQVAVNNRFAHTVSARDAAVMAAVRKGVKHVIFVIKENRTYDQILGDLEIGNGDPGLAEFGEPLTPNLHKLARTFVTLDNFMATAETSTEGWPWTTSARAPDLIEHQYPIVYASRGLALDSEGTNRNVNVAIAKFADRLKAMPALGLLPYADEDLLAGTANAAAPDGPDNSLDEGKGYLWDAALRAGLTVRSYGFFVDTTRYGSPSDSINSYPNAYHTPFASKIQVAFPTSVSLNPFTDIYYRGFDNACPDYYRFQEWARDFDANEKSGGGLPTLSLVRLMHDHTGNFTDTPTAILAKDGLTAPETQVADNDYAVGLLIEKISKSRYANDTLIFVVEDDAQDGPDHMDSHRTVALVAGAFVKQHTLVSTQYNTIDYVRTIEEVLGLPPMNLNDALAKPMADVFSTTPNTWAFTAIPSNILYTSQLPLPPPPPDMVALKPTHDAEYWARVTKGMDFTSEDLIDFGSYNRIFWRGLMGNRPYPSAPTGKDLRRNRAALLARYQRALAKPQAVEQ